MIHPSHKQAQIIGITGAFGSGKSTASIFFQERGFERITLSSFLEDEAKKKNLPITREVLQNIGNVLREQFGKHILAQKALEFALGKQKIVIDGIRNVGEIETFREKGTFTLLAIVSDRKKRFERLQAMKRREHLNWELFERLDYRDLGIKQEENGLQVAACIALSDVFIENNSGKDELEKRLTKFLQTYE